MRRWIGRLGFLSAVLLIGGSSAAMAQNVGAVTSGNWNNGSTWTTGTVPGSSNNVYIGSSYPSAAIATVTLTQAESAGNVYLGNGSGTDGTLDLAGNSLTISGNLVIGQSGGIGTLNEAGGSFTAQNVFVENGNSLTFGAADSVGFLNLSGGSSVTTAGVDNVIYGANVSGGSALTLGANLSTSIYNNGTSNYVNIQDQGSTLNMGGHSLSTGTLDLGYNGSSSVTLEDRGTITAGTLNLGNAQAFTFGAADSVGFLNLYGGSSVTTAGVGNVIYGASISGGSTLTLGASLSTSIYNNGTSNNVNIQDQGSTLNMGGHSLSTGTLDLGYYGSSSVTLENRGTITAGTLNLGNVQAFTFGAADSVGSLNLNGGSSVTTAAVGNVTYGVNVSGGSTLTLGANLNTVGNLNVQDSGSEFDAQGHAITANNLYLGWSGSSPVNLTNLGQVTLAGLYVGNGTALTLHGGDVINSQIDLQNGSVLTVQQTNGIGLTLNGMSSSSLTIDPSSMDLIFTSTASNNWDFRWADPSSTSNWIGTIDGMIHDGQIVLTLLPGQSYQVVDSGGYTYIYGIGGAAVPEPSSLVLFGMGTLGVIVAARWRRR